MIIIVFYYQKKILKLIIIIKIKMIIKIIIIEIIIIIKIISYLKDYTPKVCVFWSFLTKGLFFLTQGCLCNLTLALAIFSKTCASPYPRATVVGRCEKGQCSQRAMDRNNTLAGAAGAIYTRRQPVPSSILKNA